MQIASNVSCDCFWGKLQRFCGAWCGCFYAKLQACQSCDCFCCKLQINMPGLAVSVHLQIASNVWCDCTLQDAHNMFLSCNTSQNMFFGGMTTLRRKRRNSAAPNPKKMHEEVSDCPTCLTHARMHACMNTHTHIHTYVRKCVFYSVWCSEFRKLLKLFQNFDLPSFLRLVKNSPPISEKTAIDKIQKKIPPPANSTPQNAHP